MLERLFIAISYDDNALFKHIQQRISAQLQPLLMPYNGIIREQKHIHLTLYFLGSRSPDLIPSIIEDCQQAIQKHKMHYGSHSLMQYSSHISLKIMKHGVVALMFESLQILSDLYSYLVTTIEKDSILIADVRPFLAHITLARIKNTDQKVLSKIKILLIEALNTIAYDFKNSVSMTTHEIILFSSDQVTYKEIARFEI